MLYGYFFYPLSTLGAQHVIRAGELAVKIRCSSLPGQRARPTFAERIACLEKHGIISGAARAYWDYLREMRNSNAHPDGQELVLPQWNERLVDRVRTRIEALFKQEEIQDAN